MASNAPHTPFLAFVSDAKEVATVKQFAAANGWPEGSVQQGDIRLATQYLKDHASPALLLVEIPSANEAQALLDALAEVCAPETKVIVTGTINEYSFFCWLMDIGISSYLLQPLSESALENAYAKSTAPAAAAGPVSLKVPGKVIAVIGARGGIGSTTLAISLAGIFAEAKKKTALVDTDPQEGSVAITMDLEPSKGFREALEKPDRIDSLFLERVMHKHGPNLSVLSSEETLQERMTVHDAAATALLKELKDQYQIVVLDIPRHLGNFSRQCLAGADHVVLVTEMSLVALRDTLRITDMMRETYKMHSPIVIANRMGMASKHAVKEGDFEKGTNLKIAHKIPYAPDVYMPVSVDIPGVKSKGHAAVKPLYELASHIVPEVKVEKGVKPEKSGGLFNRKPKGPKPPPVAPKGKA